MTRFRPLPNLQFRVHAWTGGLAQTTVSTIGAISRYRQCQRAAIEGEHRDDHRRGRRHWRRASRAGNGARTSPSGPRPSHFRQGRHCRRGLAASLRSSASAHPALALRLARSADTRFVRPLSVARPVRGLPRGLRPELRSGAHLQHTRPQRAPHGGALVCEPQ
jgi:hypothetical protein